MSRPVLHHKDVAEPGFDLRSYCSGFCSTWNVYQLLHPELGSMQDLTVVWGIFPSLQEVTDFEDRKISGRSSDQDPARHDGDGEVGHSG